MPQHLNATCCTLLHHMAAAPHVDRLTFQVGVDVPGCPERVNQR